MPQDPLAQLLDERACERLVVDFVGEYHDRFVRTPDGWRIAHRRCEMAFVRPRRTGT